MIATGVLAPAGSSGVAVDDMQLRNIGICRLPWGVFGGGVAYWLFCSTSQTGRGTASGGTATAKGLSSHLR